MEALSFITPGHLALVPVVVGLVQGVKGFIETDRSSRWVPVAAIAIGVGLSALIGGGLVPIVVGGIVVGLSACGLYSASATIKNG